MSQEKIVQHCAGELAVMSFNFSMLFCNFPLNAFTARMYHLVCSLYLGVPGIVGGREEEGEQVVVLLS